MIIDEEAYLEHYGVKGQKWGIRKFLADRQKKKAKKYGTFNQAVTGNITVSQRQARAKRNFRRALAFGALWVAATVVSHKKVPVSNIGGSRTTARGAASAKDILKQERETKMAAIIKTHKEGFIDDAQKANFLKVMDARYARKIAEAV